MDTVQIPQQVFMVRPAHFGFNTETAESNAFQKQEGDLSPQQIQEAAVKEFDAMVATMRDHGIDVRVFEDTDQPVKSDAVFPNNWVSFHPDGSVILYPMMAQSRRPERRTDIVTAIQTDGKYNVRQLVDLSDFEKSDKFCEGTGSLIIDHINGILYACLSPRTHRDVVDRVAEELEFDVLYFKAYGADGTAIYHTNVLMTLSDAYAIVCLDSIREQDERELLIKTLKSTKRQIIDITKEQMGSFCGNVFPVMNQKGVKFLVMSQQAYDGFTLEQRASLSAWARLLPVDIKTIETYGGGSARCMITGIHLPKSDKAD